MTHAPPAKKRPDAHDDDPDEDDSRLLPPPPDGGWGWVVVFASFMIHIATDGVTYSFGVFYVEFLDYFHEGKGATAWIASILVGVTLCSGPISSSLVNKYGCRAVTIAGAILASACLIISIFAKNVFTLYITIGLGTGFGFGLIYLPAIVSVTCYFERLRSLATGIAVCGSGLGTFIFAPFTEWLIVEYGWRGAMLIIAALMLNCVIMGALFRPVPSVVPSRAASVAELPREAAASPAVTDLAEAARMNTSEHNLHLLSTPLGTENGKIQRPHSVSNFSPTRPTNRSTSSCGGQRRVGASGNSDVARLALSQPALQTSAGNTDYKLTYGSQSLNRRISGVMYRKDIFYRGSLHNIPHVQHRFYVGSFKRAVPVVCEILVLETTYESMTTVTCEPSIVRSTQRLHQDAKLPEAASLMEVTAHSNGHIYKSTTLSAPRRDRVIMCGCVPCSRETRDTLTEMLDFSLLRDPIFILFTLSNFFTSIGFNIPYVYLVAQAEERNIPTDQASLLLSVIGVANTVGRIILGYVSDKSWINRLWVYNTCLTICGVATALSAFCYDFYSFAVYGAVFGFTIGAYVGLTSVILVDLLGLDRLTNAFGLLLLFQGLASLVGPPIAGWLYDAFFSYDPGFYVSGVTIAMSGLMLFFIPSLQRYVAHKNKSSACYKNGDVAIRIGEA